MFWGVTLESGKRYSQVVESSYHLSMAALEPNGKEARKPNKHVSVMIENGKSEFLMCTLEYDRVMQVALDLLFVEGEEVSFFLNGEGIVHLTGYVTGEDRAVTLTSDPSDEESESVSSETEENCSSKLMVLDDESESTGEEWTPKKAALKKKKKILKQSNILKAMGIEERKSPKHKESSLAESTENQIKKEKSSSKEDHVSLSSESDEEIEDIGEESDDEDESNESELSKDDEEESDDSNEEIVYPPSKKKKMMKKDDEEESDDSNEEIASPPSKKKKVMEKSKDFTPKNTIPNDLKKGPNKTPLQKDVPRTLSATPNITSLNKNVEALNKNIGSSKKKSEILGNKKETPSIDKSKNNSSQKNKMETPSSSKNVSTPKNINESTAVSTGKKKKKKRSLSEDNTSFTEASKKDTPSITLQGGIKVTDTRQGNGPQAKKGKFVHVCYVGKLNNGVEFDSARDRPFSFRLGCGEVIKGLDTGIEGMKVGGKRKLTIPPFQGYGNKKVGPIPPNSTLQFEVELKAVS